MIKIKGKTYLSGPMNTQQSVDRLFKIATLLTTEKIEVINPVDITYGKTSYAHLPAEGLRHGIANLTESENIILTPGWENARGCIIEMFTAALTGTKMFTLNEQQLKDEVILLEKYEIPTNQLNITIAKLLFEQNKQFHQNN